MLKARLIRFAFALHRWMGVLLGLLMLLWCVTGIVMIWQCFVIKDIIEDHAAPEDA